MIDDRLREAARVLRQRAWAATPGPWIAEYSKPSGHCVIDAESTNCLDSVARATHFRDSRDARFIATMHPGVALALADWLDEAGQVGDGFIPDEAFRVADLILGTE